MKSESSCPNNDEKEVKCPMYDRWNNINNNKYEDSDEKEAECLGPNSREMYNDNNDINNISFKVRQWREGGEMFGSHDSAATLWFVTLTPLASSSQK